MQETFTYTVREAKWGMHFLDKPMTLTLTPEGLEVTKQHHSIFKATYTDLAQADYQNSNGYWYLITKDGQTVSFQTHGALTFANREIRQTDVNERLNAFLDAHAVPGVTGHPERFIIKKAVPVSTRLRSWLGPKK